MAELSERQADFVEKLERGQRISSVLGCVLLLAGLAYVTFALVIFDPRADPREQPRWDRPVAGLSELYRPYRPIIRAIRPQTDVEHLLHDGVKRNIAFSTGIMILLVRVLVGTVLCLSGMAALTVVVERRRLLSLVSQLRA
jgi:hypothetical protein